MRNLAGLGRLVRLILRRDRFILPLWVLVFSLLPTAVASAFSDLYPTPEEVADAATQFGTNPSFNGLLGPIYGETLGSLVAWRNSILFVILGVVSLLTVIRHTRVEEETGRRELLGSTVVGRHAPLTAALATVAGANFVIGALVATTLPGSDLPVTGSIALGIAIAASGIVFAAVGAVAAQVTETAGGARGIGVGAIAVAFVLRAAGDSAGDDGAISWLSWLSPLGWAQRIRPYASERWWVVAALAALTLVVGAVAYLLSVRRDVGSGLVPARLGPAYASPQLSTPLALAWRLHRGLVVGWSAGLAVLGVVYGSVADGVTDLISDNPDMREMFERLGGAGALIDLYLSGVMSILALIASGYAVQAALRLRVEEEALRAEPILATSVSRLRWLSSHLLFAFVGPTVAVMVAGFAAGLTYGVIAGEVVEQVPRLLGAAAAQLPAVWLLAAVAVALFGILPRLTQLGWVIYGAVLLITLLGAVLGLDQWVLDLSPFVHVPTLPGGELLLAPLAWLVVVGGLFVVGGFSRFSQRDIG